MRPLISVLILGFALTTLSACMGSEKGTDAGWGFFALDTVSKEDKENEKWFKSFYGTNHCHGQWAGDCEDESSGGGGGGGMWGGGVGPSSTGHGGSGNASASSTD